jgi:hypothetical protein
MKKDRFTAIGSAASFLAIIIPILTLCYYVGQQSKQISINTGILQNVALRESVQELKNDNNNSHIEIKNEISNLDLKIDTYILKSGNEKKVAYIKINPYFDNSNEEN